MRHLVHFLLTFSTYTVLINGQGVLPAESSLSLDPLVTLVGCLREEKPGYCLQRRALNFFESWLTTQGDDEDIGELNQADDTSERLPAGLSPYWSKLVDSVAERLSKMYGEEEDEPEESIWASQWFHRFSRFSANGTNEFSLNLAHPK